jgi:Zn-dependent protease
MMDETSTLFRISTWVVPVLLAITLHEASHGFVALRFGDDTALRAGRVTFNPLRHIDPFGTIILPIMLLLTTNGGMAFGYAKPVPVDFMRLRPLRPGVVAVAFAGPGSNLVLAAVSALLFNVVDSVPESLAPWVYATLTVSILINLILFFFNLIPIPPLDGGRIAVAVLPPNLASPLARLERAGFVIILVALFVLPLLGNSLGIDLDIFRWLIGGPALATGQWLLDVLT